MAYASVGNPQILRLYEGERPELARSHHQTEEPNRAFSGEVDPVHRRQCVTRQDESRFHIKGNGSCLRHRDHDPFEAAPTRCLDGRVVDRERLHST
jgi:hypothetical protein